MEHTEEDDQLAVSSLVPPIGLYWLLWDTGATYSALPEAIAEKRQLTTLVRGNTKFGRNSASATGHDFGPIEFVVQPLKLPLDFDGCSAEFLRAPYRRLDYKLREIRVRLINPASNRSLLERFTAAIHAQDKEALPLFAEESAWTPDGGGNARAVRKVISLSGAPFWKWDGCARNEREELICLSVSKE